MSTLLKLFWPYLFRFMMNQGSERAAEYLETRRLQRLARVQQFDETDLAEALVDPDEPVDRPLEIVCSPSPPPSFFASDGFWFTLSGIVLGMTLSIVAYILKRETEKL
jgi:hypothetical protein